MYPVRRINLHCFLKVTILVTKIYQLFGRYEHARLAVHMRNLCVLVSSANPDSRLEHRQLYVAACILEKVSPVVRLVRARNDQVIIAVLIIIHGKRPGPQSHAKVHDQSGIIVFHSLRSLCTELGAGI